MKLNNLNITDWIKNYLNNAAKKVVLFQISLVNYNDRYKLGFRFLFDDYSVDLKGFGLVNPSRNFDSVKDELKKEFSDKNNLKNDFFLINKDDDFRLLIMQIICVQNISEKNWDGFVNPTDNTVHIIINKSWDVNRRYESLCISLKTLQKYKNTEEIYKRLYINALKKLKVRVLQSKNIYENLNKSYLSLTSVLEPEDLLLLEID